VLSVQETGPGEWRDVRMAEGAEPGWEEPFIQNTEFGRDPEQGRVINVLSRVWCARIHIRQPILISLWLTN
jgi:hypothetical protein